MIKYFCDACEKRLESRMPSTVKPTDGVIVHIRIARDEGHICLHCFIDAVNKLDDRK